MGLAYRLPEIGEMVGDYRIVEMLGSGSYGHVFKAEQAGCFYAVKILRGRLLHDRAKREIRILLHLDHPDVVRFFGCGYWPDPIIGHSYIVMGFAGGRTLEAYAQEENPSARRAARIILDTALTLGEVLRQGVMHRDLKPDNIIIRDGNARPLLIDFGVGTLVGAPAVTSSRLPPGTIEFRASEAWRFSRENADDSASYDYGPADELWALGVTFYWLLMDVLPFGDREDEEGGGLAERILHQTPVAPHVLNPRVPRALSDICMRLLEKDPAARYTSVVEFCAALDGAMAEADSSWDLPLFDPDALHNRTTEEEPALADANDSMRWLRRWQKEKRRRGRKPPEKAPAPEVMERAGDAPAPVAEVLAAVPEQKAPAVVAVAPPPPEPVAPPAPQAPAPHGDAQATAVRVPLRAAGGVLPMRAMVLDVLKRPALVLGLAAWVFGVALVVKQAEPASVPTDVTVSDSKGKAAFLLPGFTDMDPIPQACFVREVALPWKPLESVGGAVPVLGTLTPAPFAIAMLRKDDTSLKTEETRAPKMQRQGLRSIVKKGCVGAACCVTLTGCPAQQVRPTPEPAPCPAGAVEAMADKLGVRVGQMVSASLTKGPTGDITIREGSTSVELGPIGPGKEGGGIFLSGTLTIGDERVYGRFTRARIQDGQPFPVCFEMWDSLKGGRGAIRERNGDPDSARIYSTVNVKAVRSFE